MKNYIEVDGLKVHWNFWLLPKDFLAITLFGNIFFNETEEWVKNYVTTQRGKITINHEKIHTLQASSFKTKYLGFYIYYIYYWIKGLFKYGTKDNIAYEHIPFEVEAYQNEKDFNYAISQWQNYNEYKKCK